MNAWLNRLSRGVLLLGAVGCGAGVNPNEPIPETSQESALTLDEKFTRMAQAVPGFGGYYYDASGALNVVMTRPSLQTSAIRALLSARGVEGNNALIVQQGQYDFADLNRWRTRLDAENIPGLVSTDVDEVRNRIALGVSSLAHREELTAMMARLMIPAGAVILEEEAPLQEHQSAYSQLNKENRPIAGGLQIKRYANGYIYFCTLGFNVRREGKPGFITNTHCTNLGNVHYQGGDRIGVTREDPPFWSNASVDYNGSTYTCSSSHVCRFSDAAYGEYDLGVQSVAPVGYIYRTEQENAYTGGEPTSSEPLRIDNAHPFFRIVGKAYQVTVGEKIHKMGQRTGWTSGLVTKTCRTTTNGSTKLFCQMDGGGAGYSGDSGSPVFRRVPGSDTDVELVGIYWGSYMSPLGNIEQDLGPLDVVADPASSHP